MHRHDDFDEDSFKGQWDHEWGSNWDSNWKAGTGGVMDIIIGIVCLVALAVILALICRCCGTSSRGRVLQPPPPLDPNSSVPAAYPQQQYSTVTVTTVPVGHSTRPPYPTTGVSYPTAGAPYPGAPGPYPGTAGPYTAVGAPYPAVSPYPPGPYPSAMPQPSIVPSAPDAQAFIGVAPPGWHTQALPPSYDQVMSNEAKHPPFNPYAPH